MLLLMSVLILMQTPCTECNNVGSIFFNNHRIDRDCWSQEDLAKLKARKVFENITLPVVVPPDQINTRYIRDAVKYFRKALHLVEKDTNEYSANIIKQALQDAIGGHLQSEILPNVRLAYYAGYIPYRSARHIHNFFEEVKTSLNTQGLGWRRPPRIPDQSNLTVSKILIGSGKFFDPCSHLITNHDPNGCIHLPYPKVDDTNQPAAVALPFKTGGLVGLASPKSENILLKYYTTASRCILHNSPEKCRHKDFVNFNNDLWHWMKRDVAPHLVDDKLYAAYGGVLRVAAAVQNYGKGLSRRNLYDYESYDYPGKWHPWRTLTNTKVTFDTDWTPQIYIGIVLAIVLLISLLQMSYSFIFGSGCSCKCPYPQSKNEEEEDKQALIAEQVSYAKIGASFPKAIPVSSYGSRRPVKNSVVSTSTGRGISDNKHKSVSLGTMRTQRVYDFNENTEKMMSVIMSDYEGSAYYTSESEVSATEEPTKSLGDYSSKTRTKTSSPPKIQAPMSQLKLQKSSRSEQSGIPMYSTSTISRSEVTYRNMREPPCRRSVCTATSCTTSCRSASSGSSQSPTQSPTQTTMRSKRSRDIAWARRVISQTTRRDATTKSHSTTGTGTEVDYNSYTTPPSKR